jgi:leader peptidase (prepilin peptidase) / N-methyltransferase
MFFLLLVIGLVAGSFINAAIYALAWHWRPISPWQPRHVEAPPRRWQDFLPVVGWLGLSRESSIHGRGFWVRPLLIELFCALGLPALYWWEMSKHLAPDLPIMGLAPATGAMLLHQFIPHSLLIGLMLVATFIDFDEKTIPDEITIPGALLGLFLAAYWPDSQLPVIRPLVAAIPTLIPVAYQPLLLTSTSAWPAWLNETRGLMLSLAIFWGWCLALVPATATLRRGWWNGVRYYFASVARHSAWWKMLLIGLVGSAGIIVVWRNGGQNWQTLLSSLVGLGFGGGLVWAVRIAGRAALNKEAMGFGDVTLMAMIGAFLGWQACLIIFFLSPFVALIIALVQWILTGRRDIPYGPYLCISAVALILKWPWFWDKMEPYFELGWVLPAIIAACICLLFALLLAWRRIESFLWRSES